MSKIKIRAFLKMRNDEHLFNGYGIKNKDIFIYKDGDTLTKIIVKDDITVERVSEYKLLLKFKEGTRTEGILKSSYGDFKVNINTRKIFIYDLGMKILYDLEINQSIDTFEYIFEYTIDS